MARRNNPKRDSSLQIPQQETEKTDKSLSKLANHKIEESLKEFSEFSEKEREDLFWTKEFFEQFWEFFKEQHPNLLDEIDSQEKLTIYVQNLEKKGFPLEKIMNKTPELHEEFKETLDEKTTIIQELKKLQEYCDKGENKMPAHIFQNFANDIKLGTSPITITKATKISKIWNLFSVRTHYIEDNGITIQDHQKSQIEKILSPSYLPTERLLISATIKKIKKNLPNNLIPDFEANFQLPIDIHSPFENLKNLQQQRTIFLDSHKTEIDENLAKKLDKIIVTNGDIYQELQYEWENIERTKGFSEQTKNFRRMFNKLATRQLFEEAKETGAYVAHHLEQIGKEFKAFPPYFNELLNIYPYKQQTVIEQQPIYKAEYNKQENLLTEIEKEFEKPNLSEQQKQDIHKQIFDQKNKLNNIKWAAYAEYIKTQNPEIWNIISQLIDNNFNIKKLWKSDQQKILNILVSSKLDDSIKNQIPNVLWTDPKEYETFVKNLFDLNQKEISIPTQYGNIQLHFSEKEFLWWPTKDFMEITTNGEILSEQKNLPLNFKVQITEQNKDFFENNILFEDFYDTFHGKNWDVNLCDSYKVNITNNEGKSVEWYLSQYPPTESIDQAIKEDKNVKEGRFLYSHPITRPEDARQIVTWDGDTEGDPVVILKDQEKNHTIDILSKEINLNGEAISSLLFSYPLGQYNIKNNLTKDQEKKLAEKFGKINKENMYIDSLDMQWKTEQEKKEETTPKEDIETEKKKERKEFLEERKNIKGYQEEDSEKEQTYGFKKGAKLLIQWPESSFQPSWSFQYITAEITDIDENSNKFKMKFHWNEQSLWQRENTEKQFSLTKKWLQNFKNIFDDKIYKLPNQEKINNINSLIPALQTAGIDDIKPSDSFKETSRTGNNFMINLGKEKWENVTHFWLVETHPGDDPGKESKKAYMYEIHHEPLKKKFKVIANDENKTTLHLDYPNFILFIASKKLQPQTEQTAKGIEIINKEWVEVKWPKKRKWYSFASIVWLVKNFGKKIGDWLKKYEEEQTEDLTDKMFYHWKFFYSLAKVMPTTKRQEAFENAGHEYRTERDNKVYKKIEKYLKFYETDPDFWSPTSWNEQVAPYLHGKKKFRDHHQAAALLIATIKKGKWPYSRNTERSWKGMRVRLLLWEDHQKRYILVKEKLERELQQWYKIYGQNRADDRQNEILKLEMKYLIDSIDGRHLQYRPDTEKFEAMYSKKYACDMLEAESNKFFSESVKNSTKEQSYSFELARFEFFRYLTNGRVQQAIPNIKQMALKAISPSQWDALKNAILVGMLSGMFYNISQEDKKYIQRISRSFGFLPGILVRDPNHHQKIAKIIEIATGEKIKYGKKEYDPKIFWFGKIENWEQTTDFINYNKGASQRLLWTNSKGKKRLDIISNFLWRKENNDGKTLIQLLNDEKTSNADRELLQDFYNRRLEKNENLDTDVHDNGKILEQNILCKNQSHINEIIDFDNWSFKWKNEDDRQNKADARSTISKTIPRKKISDKNEIISYVQMFMNWFEDKGFNTEEKRFLIRTLVALNNNKKESSADEMLRYVIVWNIIRSSWHGQPPDQLVGWLEAVKDFFENNIETIIEPDVIEKWFGHIFLEELNKKPFKVAPWEEYVDLKINRQHMIWKSKEENQLRTEKRRLYEAEETYINSKMYYMAEQIYNRNYIPNRFKKYYDPEVKKTTIKDELKETLGPKSIHIKNHDKTVEKIKKKLSWELKEGLTEDQILEMEELDDDYYNEEA